MAVLPNKRPVKLGRPQNPRPTSLSPAAEKRLEKRLRDIRQLEQQRKDAKIAKAKQQFISGVISGQNKQRIDPRLGPGAAFATGAKEAGKALVTRHPAVTAAKIVAAKAKIAAAIAAKNLSKNKPPKKKRRTCSRCGSTNHTALAHIRGPSGRTPGTKRPRKFSTTPKRGGHTPRPRPGGKK